MQKFPRCWTDKEKINYLQRKIILNSIAYYEFNTSFLLDKEFDELSKQLVEIQKNFSGDLLETQYGYVMFDFDGSTGFDLYHRLNEKDKDYLLRINNFVLKNKEYTRKKKGKLF